MRISLFIVILFNSLSLFAQIQTAADGSQFFEMEYQDSTIIMKQYFICFLNKGDNRSQSDVEAAKIQEQHLAHLSKLYEAGYTCITGPFGDDGHSRGIVIFKTATKEEAMELASQDPAVKAGRLSVEIRPWWAMKGAVLD